MNNQALSYFVSLVVVVSATWLVADYATQADDAAFVEVYSEPAPEVGLTHPEVQKTLDAVDLEPVPDAISDPCNCKPTCQCTANQCNAQGCNPAANVLPKKAVSQPKACFGNNCRPRRRGVFGLGLF